MNECLETGPLLQKLIWNILVANRFKPIVLTADIKQAFLQIRIRKEDRDVLRSHLLKDLQYEEMQILRYTRVVFGLIQSPFLLGGTLEPHLDNSRASFPAEIIEQILECLHVDDLIGGGFTEDKVFQLKKMVIELFKNAGFTLHKWHSNVLMLEDNKTNEEQEITYAKHQLNDLVKDESKILSICWDKRNDKSRVIVSQREGISTKCGILRMLVSVYDPLGFISPVWLTGKIIYRAVCDEKIGWDQQIPGKLNQLWLKYVECLPQKIEIPRSSCPWKARVEYIDFHAFGDANLNGTAAIIYAVIKQPTGVSQGLIAAKSRLSKAGTSIPCLKLVASLMTTNLIENVKKSLSRLSLRSFYAWTDITVALHWIRSNGNYKQYVRNRVNKIKSKN